MIVFLPPYSLELNCNEILLKQANHFWRQPMGLSGAALREEVETLMDGFGRRFTTQFVELHSQDGML